MIKNPWTPWQLDWLAILYPDYSAEELVVYLGHPVKTIRDKAARLKIRKSAEFLSSNARRNLNSGNRGTSSQFVKGQPAWNKGKKGYCPQGAGFLLGNKPVNSKPLGIILKQRSGYLKIKTAMHPAKWEMLHVVNWKEAGNPLPVYPEVFKFKDGNKLNCSPENLEITTKRKVMAENTVHNLPEDLKEVVKLNGMIVRKINGKHNRNS